MYVHLKMFVLIYPSLAVYARDVFKLKIQAFQAQLELKTKLFPIDLELKVKHIINMHSGILSIVYKRQTMQS